VSDLTVPVLAEFFEKVLPHLDERQRRVTVGAMAVALGRGGQARVVEASRMSSHTVWKGSSEVRAGVEVSDRVRAVGGGDLPAVVKQPGLLDALDRLVDPETRGDPMTLLRWTSKSTYKLADELTRMGFQASAELVRRLLRNELGYSLQALAKQREGTQSPDRDGQFRYIGAQASEFAAVDEPVISVDTKKKELVGAYKNGGTEWQPKKQPEEVEVHDFPKPGIGKAVPYGVYDLMNDEGWVSVGDSSDTAEFAVSSIRSWWLEMGKARYPDARRLLITADAGGSNGYRVRAWKYHLSRFAQETGLQVTVGHFPPGTSKWNKIEHRMFSFISMNWRGRPLESIRTIIELISGTATESGLTIQARYDPNVYERGLKISDEQMAAVNLVKHGWHGDWNYTILPK
jgi:hypothetical protein